MSKKKIPEWSWPPNVGSTIKVRHDQKELTARVLKHIPGLDQVVVDPGWNFPTRLNIRWTDYLSNM